MTMRAMILTWLWAAAAPALSYAVQAPAPPLPLAPSAPSPTDNDDDVLSEDDLLAPADVTPQRRALVRKWIGDLAAPSATARQSAEDRLRGVGPIALPFLQRAFTQSRDFDVRMHIEDVARDLYMDARLFLRNAFLGISISERIVTHGMDPRVPQDGDGIVIRDVVRGTAAEEAGLRDDDVIILMDSESVHLSPAGADSSSFSELLRKKPIGSIVHLSVLRRGELRDFVVTLRPRPRELYSSLQSPALFAQRRKIEGEFAQWWRVNFLSDDRAPNTNQWIPPRPASQKR